MTNFHAAKKWSQHGLENRKRGGIESASGPGSSISSTKSARKLIIDTIKNENIKRVLDLGCGDWNWMKTIRKEFADVYYEGWDCSTEIVAELNDEHGNDNTKFYERDIIVEEYGQFDLVICRDVLFHLSIENALKVLSNIERAGIPNLITSSFLDITKNTDIRPYNHIKEDWGFYKINLNIEPFNMGDFMTESIPENILTNGYVRSICLYRI